MEGSRKLKNPNRAWIRPLTEQGGARYQQIVRQIATAVDDLVLRPGDRLPPQRELATALGVDLTTVTRAYSELRALGLLEAQGAGGSYIKRKASGPDTTVDLGMNIPPLLDGSFFAQLMRAGVAHAQERMGSGDPLMSYHVGAGAPVDRQAAAAWLQPMLGAVDPGRIVICPGGQSALGALLLTCSRPGDGVLTEGLTYPGLLAAAQTLDRSVVAVAADAQGMSPDALEDACARGGARVLYLNPTIHNPTTRTLSAERRAALHAVASRHGLAIIEDDPYWRIAGDAPAPLAALSGQSGAKHGAPVYYISTLSKCLAPGLRTAFIAMPHGAAITPVLDALRSISLMPASWMTAVATHAIETGMAHDMVKLVRHELAQRQRLAGRLLPQGVQCHPHGLHLWLELPPLADPYRLIQIAQQRGVGVADADAFRADESVHKALRISLGGAMSQEQLRVALEKLSAILQEEHRPARATGIV